MTYEFYIWAWLVIGLLGYMVGLVTDSILYKRKLKIEGVDIAIVLLSLAMGPLIWAVVLKSVIAFFVWYGKVRKKNNGEE